MSKLGKASTYDKAERILRKRGWHKGDFMNYQGKVCILGAINVAKKQVIASYPGDDIYQALRSICDDNYPEVFNDANGRTENEVCEVLLAAASLCLSEAARK